MRILGFGGCRINNPLSHAEDSDERVLKHEGQWVPSTFALNEAIQAIDVWNGDTSLPDDLKPVISFWGRRLVAQPRLVAGADCIVIETSQQVELFLDGYAVNRNAVSDKLIKPVVALGKDAHRAVSRWYNTGIKLFDEVARKELATALIPHISDDIPDAPVLRYLVENMRSQPATPEASLRAIKERVDAPIGYITHTWQFMSDGRQIHIPDGFYAEVLDAVKRLELPIMFPEEDILDFGVARAMRPDFRHYSDEFIPTISNKMVDYALRVAG